MFDNAGAALLVLISFVLPVAAMFVLVNRFRWASIDDACEANSRLEQNRYERAGVFSAVCAIIGVVGLATSLGAWKKGQLTPLEATKTALEAPAVRVESFRLITFANIVSKPAYLQTDQGRLALEILERESNRQQMADAVTIRPKESVLEAHELTILSLAG